MYGVIDKYLMSFLFIILITLIFSLSAAVATDLSERAKKLDINKNGFIDKNEAIGPLKTDFEAIDNDNNEMLDGSEISNFFKKKFGSQSDVTENENSNPKILPSRIKFLDKNNNNLIERKEASGFIANRFSSIDTNSDNIIDPKELNTFFTANKSAVFTDKVELSKLSQTVSIIGRLVGNANGPISSKVSGTITEVMVKVGDKVKKGDFLIKIQQDQFELEAQKRFAIVRQRQSQVKIAQAELEKVLLDQKRIEGLKNSSAFSKKKFDNITQDIIIKKSVVNERESLLEQAVEELNRANLNLKNTIITSPFSGMVIKINTGIGSYISTGMTALTLLDMSNLEISAQVPTKILSSLKIGKKVSISFDNSNRFHAFVRAILPEENQLTRTAEVRFSIQRKNLDDNLSLNKSVNINMPVYSKEIGITVHKDGVISKDNKSYVFVVSQGKVKEKVISLMGSNDNRFIVREGLKEGDLVVIRGNESLRDNQNVKVLNTN
ncbi:MAG: Macrolide export protein MacA [Alphaproteobacteria bacterium MarineAlpha2_Bin1]|nr:MAG: Macrolide export protein MacA [Alphaproteobacteria bacterium MarineAlpha2_Bin1]|tara:strand:+ start:363 stop:1844 length:1482 start_codon:yes stop_codon:yes gene_type:complete